MKANNSASNYAKRGVLWAYRNDKKIQEFPDSDLQRYITKPSEIVSDSALKSKNIDYPEPLPVDLTLLEDILNSAIARHSNKYFDAHMGEGFITLIVMLRGRYKAQTPNATYCISNACYFVLPAKMPVMYFAQEKRFELIWFHIKNTKNWRRVFGDIPRCGKMENFQNFVNLYDMYSKEIYSPNRSISYLRSILTALIETIKKEFINPQSERIKALYNIDSLLENIRCNISKDWRVSAICKLLKLTPYKLNKIFEARYGMSCKKYITKIKMEKSLELLKLGYSLEEIRKKLGFATAFSYSTAFKDFFGVSPRKYDFFK